jgi:hypothetical protein
VLRSSGWDRYEGYRDIAHVAIDGLELVGSGFAGGVLESMRDLLLNIMREAGKLGGRAFNFPSRCTFRNFTIDVTPQRLEKHVQKST